MYITHKPAARYAVARASGATRRESPEPRRASRVRVYVL